MCQPAPFLGVVPPAYLNLSPQSTPPPPRLERSHPAASPAKRARHCSLGLGLFTLCRAWAIRQSLLSLLEGQGWPRSGHSYSYLRNLLTH